MTMKPVGAERFSLARWSRRKLASTLEKTTPAAAPAVGAPAPTATATAGVELPPVESLTFDSDFTAFLKPGVDPAVKQAALKKLLRDPRFNVMDGLDVYIDDYTKSDPIPPDMLADLLDRFDRSTAPSAAAETEAARDDSPPAHEAPPVIATGSATPAAAESVSKPQPASKLQPAGDSPRLADRPSAPADAAAAGPQSVGPEPLPARESSSSQQTEDR
jgi:hypothetical protein